MDNLQSSIQQGRLELCMSSFTTDYKQIGDEGVKQICALDTHNVRLMNLCIDCLMQVVTTYLQLASLQYPKATGTTSNAWISAPTRQEIRDANIYQGLPLKN